MEFFLELLITAVLSILLAFLLGKIFSIPDDDLVERDPSEMAEPQVDPQLERRKIGGGEEATASKICREVVEEGIVTAAVVGSDRIEASEVSQEARLVKDSFDLEKECEEENRFGVHGIRFDEISAKEMPEEVEIERIDVDLVKEEEERFLQEKETPEGAKASQFGLEEEVNEVRLEEDSAKEMFLVVGAERANADLLREEERLLKEEERSKEARTSEFDLEIREGVQDWSGKRGVSEVESKAAGEIQSGVVEKAAAVLGAGGIEAIEVSRDDDEVNRLEEDRLVKDSFDLEKECEEKRFGANGDRLYEVTAKEMPDKVEVERIVVDLVKQKEGLLKENESPKEAKASEFGLEKEVNEVRLEQDSAKELPEVVGTERIDADLFKEEERLLKEEERSQEARASEFDLEKKRVEKRSQMTGAKDYSEKALPEEVEVERADAYLVKDNKCEEKIVELTEEEIVLKEGSESEIRGGEKSGIDEKEPLLFDEVDEWEGIERTELEKLFGEAAAYVGSESGGAELSRLSSDEIMQLYGLHKVATEGPCYDPQPMALKVSARARWNAWQRLGNMNPEVAMEQYMTLLSEKIPGWKGEKPGGNIEHEGSDSLEPTVPSTGMPDLCSTLDNKLSSETERKPEGPFCIDEKNESAVPKHFEQGLTKTN